jgi:hypothetical protein
MYTEDSEISLRDFLNIVGKLKQRKRLLMEKEFSCSGVARDYNVPLIGTATRGDIWFLIEYAHRWEAKAFEMSEIPDEVKSYIGEAASNSTNKVRTLLIRRPEIRKVEQIHFFVGQVTPTEPRLYAYEMRSYMDILDLDLISLAAGSPGDIANFRNKPLFLVCTNGRRDKCCSVYGPDVYQAISEEAEEDVWQSSHIGGHNQAPVTLFFPHGVSYGKTTPADIREVVRAYQQREVVLQHYRGRVCFDVPIQAAEHFWREHTGILDLPGLKVDQVSEIAKDKWVVSISSMEGKKEDIHLESRQSDFEIPITCSGEKRRVITSFHHLG